jgi:hypothetical protein
VQIVGELVTWLFLPWELRTQVVCAVSDMLAFGHTFRLLIRCGWRQIRRGGVIKEENPVITTYGFVVVRHGPTMSDLKHIGSSTGGGWRRGDCKYECEKLA